MKYIIRFSFASILFLAIVAITAFYRNERSGELDKVQTDAGYVSGTIHSTQHIHIFKDIPFAAPPIGTLRWKAPQPVKHWNGVKTCNEFGPSPMQGSPAP